jgi:hypothetical protein
MNLIENENLSNKGRGRPKGSPNRTTASAKEAIAQAAEGLGGTNRLISWAQEDPANERAFWATIYPKLLPLQVSGEDGGPIQAVIRWQNEKS